MAKPGDRSEGDKEFAFNHSDFDRVRGLIYQRAGFHFLIASKKWFIAGWRGD
jgi:hypothetical protein